MKKISITLAIILASIAANAQENFDPFKDRQFIFDVFNICAILTVIYMIAGFILRIVKQSLDFKLKNKIIDKGTEEPVVAQLLQPVNKESRRYLLQWFFILAAIGIGFTIMNLTRPFGLHSLAIMAFSIAAGFGGYYYFTRKADAGLKN